MKPSQFEYLAPASTADGVNVMGSVAVPNTGSWGTFQWVGVDGILLTAGQHVLRIRADQQYFNLDALRLVEGDTTPPKTKEKRRRPH